MSEPTLEIHLDDEDQARTLCDDVRTGLTANPKWLPPKWFYDARGSALFEDITRLPEYYPTRAEREVLTAHARDIARTTNAKTLIELGSGSSDKTRLLLDAFRAHGTLGAFVPLDVSATAWPTEDYHRARSLVDTELPEDDLFAGIREMVSR